MVSHDDDESAWVAWPPVRDVPERALSPAEARIGAEAERVARELRRTEADDEVRRRRHARASLAAARAAGVRPCRRPVECVDTAEPFTSISDAARAYRIRPTTLAEAMRDGRCRSFGRLGGRRVILTFRYADRPA